MLGVTVNALAIIIGGAIGLVLKNGINDKVKKVVMQAIGLSVLIIGIMGSIVTKNILLLIFSLVIGGIIGALLRIEDRLDQLGENLEQKFQSSEGKFAKGFVLATLLYSVGAMSIVGSINAGFGDHSILFIKSILDGTTAIIFTATLGYGVIFSAIPVFLYQALIVLLGTTIEPYLTEAMINEMGAVGNVIIVGIGINLLEIKKIHVGDLLPAIFIPLIYFLLVDILPFLS
jgi:uncharacterized membrane protein YqgA involved in biofilm formation